MPANKKHRWGALLILAVVYIIASSQISTASVAERVDAYRGVAIIYNNQELTGDKQPYIIDDTTYIPLRMLMNSFGKNIYWDAANYRVVISDGPDFTVSRLNEQIKQKDEEIASLNARISSLESQLGVQADTSAIPAPTGLLAEPLSSSEIELTWDSVSGATEYHIYRAASSSAPYTKIASTADTSYVNAGLSANTRYYYKVRAVKGSYTSAYSSYVYAATGSSPSLAAPTGLAAEGVSSSEIDLYWDSVSGATEYHIYRSRTSSGTYTKIGSTEDSIY
ncbi:MAG: hypothetical protein HPY50_21085 [Firmicutes bacterium]|nr:hypothetical protein [Bacillota bacterium]